MDVEGGVVLVVLVEVGQRRGFAGSLSGGSWRRAGFGAQFYGFEALEKLIVLRVALRCRRGRGVCGSHGGELREGIVWLQAVRLEVLSARRWRWRWRVQQGASLWWLWTQSGLALVSAAAK